MDGAGRPARDLVIPHCTYADLEVATVRLTPVRVAEQGVALDTHRLELSKVERAFIERLACNVYNLEKVSAERREVARP
jgi:pyruvate/2-oxoglutarate dehydrogenase complex dihydrolipoamide dehydrogenase (E3) component